jgi:hypothetical protein
MFLVKAIRLGPREKLRLHLGGMDLEAGIIRYMFDTVVMIGRLQEQSNAVMTM